MPVFALWSAPRARSTVFFRSMVERGDLIALHEPFSNLADFGETDVEGRTVDSPTSLLTWLADRRHDLGVFLKDTTDRRHGTVLPDRRFLTEARHAFLIRRPEEIAASFYALKPDMRIDHIGLEALHELHTAVRDAGGHHPVIVDSDESTGTPTRKPFVGPPPPATSSPRSALRLFKGGVFSHEVGVRKPNRRIYEILLERTRVEARQVLFVDDKDWALVPAAQLGLKTVLFRDSEQVRQELKRLGVL
jgi:hypothetical protein